ncbi:MAG: single-stranded-DNA-specific exonuclease RecJ [Planctomycetota bacterium]
MPEAWTQARWQFESIDEGAAAELADRLGVSALEARLLVARGVADAEAARRFLEPTLTQLPDPVTLPGCAVAAERIVRAIEAGQPIVVYGDYDVDGVTASAILCRMLRLAGATVATYIPHRIDEGYGLNTEALLSIGAGELTGGRRPLVITVDCGVSAIEPCRAAAEQGVEVIVTDHHCGESGALPAAAAVVHPSLGTGVAGTQAAADWGDLSGAGVAFVLAWEVARLRSGQRERLPEEYRRTLIDLLAMAALGTVADVVRLAGPNRAIVAGGLARLPQSRVVGVRALMEANGLGRAVDTYHVGFVLGPRLNAVGRMGHAAEALELLTSDDEAHCAAIAAKLGRVNEDRRSVERRVLNEAVEQIESRADGGDERRALVVAGPGWHPGVVGIVASRLVDRYHRPAVVLGIEGEVAKGSARSVPGVSIYEALGACGSLLEKFGGHEMAAGMTLRADRVDELRDRLVERVNGELAVEALTPTRRVDVAIEPGDLTCARFDAVDRLAPFGRGNPRPALMAEGLEVAAPPRVVGKSGDHVSLSLRFGDRTVKAIGFGMADRVGEVGQGARIDAVFEPQVNEWQGRRSAEMRLIDWRACGVAAERDAAAAVAMAEDGR